MWLLELSTSYILLIAAIYQLTFVTVFALFSIRIGHIKTLDDLLPEEDQHD